MSTLQDAINAIQAKARALPGMRDAPNEPPEQPGMFPFAISYPDAGDWTGIGETFKQGMHTVRTDIHVARKDLPRDYLRLVPYADSFPNALLGDVQLGDSVTAIVGGIAYEFFSADWGNGVVTIGLRFRTTVKQIGAVS